MPLTQLSLGAALSWQLTRAVSGFAELTQGDDSAGADLTGIDLATWNNLFAAQYTLAPTGTQTVDLRSFTDLTGAAVTGTAALLLLVLVGGAPADELNIIPDGTNPLQWFFGGTTEGVNVPGGGCLLFSAGVSGTGATVDGTNRNLLLTNNGSADLTVTVLALVSGT